MILCGNVFNDTANKKKKERKKETAPNGGSIQTWIISVRGEAEKKKKHKSLAALLQEERKSFFFVTIWCESGPSVGNIVHSPAWEGWRFASRQLSGATICFLLAFNLFAFVFSVCKSAIRKRSY